MDAIIEKILFTAAGIVVSIIGFFLKRNITKVDEHDKEINAIKTDYVTKDELSAMKDELKKSIDKLSDDIDDIKANYITKEDFYREQAKLERKLDRVLDILLARKDVSGNG